VVYGLEASPGRVANSDSYEAICLYQRAAWGYFEDSGADLRALKVTTSAWVVEYLRKYVSRAFYAVADSSRDEQGEFRVAISCVGDRHNTVLDAAQ